MRLQDTTTGYGWISIALHWLTAIVIVVLLYYGSSISAGEGEQRVAMMSRHTSVAISAYVFLWARIFWRFAFGHPGPLKEQRGFFFLLGKWVHLITLVALGIMLVSGPLMAWSMGNAIVVFDWFVISSPIAPNAGLSRAMHTAHFVCAIIIFVGILLHLAGVYKHAAFNRDGTFSKMLIAAKPGAAD